MLASDHRCLGSIHSASCEIHGALSDIGEAFPEFLQLSL
jgi:hypothetical protein